MIGWAMAAGAGVGLGVWLVARGLHAPPPDLTGELDRLLHREPAAAARRPLAALARGRATGVAARLVEGAGVDTDRLSVQLRAAGRPLERYLADKAAAAAAGLLAPLAVVAGVRLAGVAVPPASAGLAALLLAGVGWWWPSRTLAADADRRRREFVVALAAWLSLVATMLAAAVGRESALRDAADAGHGWAFAELRAALARAQLTGRPAHETLTALADELDIAELAEAAASFALAGSHGAQLQATLATRATSLRQRLLVDIETAAEQATAKMSLPQLLVAFAGMTFVFYPATSAILAL